MFGFRKVSPNAKSSSQSGVVYLHTVPGAASTPMDCCVTRITPHGLRLALQSTLPISVAALFSLNRIVTVELKMPPPIRSVRTRGALVCMGANFVRFQAPMLLDLEFMALSEEEERALRDTNPSLVVA